MLRNDREKEEIEILGETKIIMIFCIGASNIEYYRNKHKR